MVVMFSGAIPLSVSATKAETASSRGRGVRVLGSQAVVEDEGADAERLGHVGGELAVAGRRAHGESASVGVQQDLGGVRALRKAPDAGARRRRSPRRTSRRSVRGELVHSSKMLRNRRMVRFSVVPDARPVRVKVLEGVLLDSSDRLLITHVRTSFKGWAGSGLS